MSIALIAPSSFRILICSLLISATAATSASSENKILTQKMVSEVGKDKPGSPIRKNPTEALHRMQARILVGNSGMTLVVPESTIERGLVYCVKDATQRNEPSHVNNTICP